MRHGPLDPARPPLPPRHPLSTVPSAWWPAGPENQTWPTTSLPHLAMAKQRRVGFFRRELWRDTQADRWLRHRWALAEVARCRTRASRASRLSPGPAVESGSGPATPGAAAVRLPNRADFWPHVQPVRLGAPIPAHAVLGGAYGGEACGGARQGRSRPQPRATKGEGDAGGKKAYSTRYSHVVSHPSTNQARSCLACEIR